MVIAAVLAGIATLCAALAIAFGIRTHKGADIHSGETHVLVNGAITGVLKVGPLFT